MNYNHSTKNNSTIVIRVMCAIVFVLFAFSWLYFFQADLLTMAQYVMSNGVTHYNSVAGTIIITLILMVLQLVVFGFTRLSKCFHALTYAPSMLLLALLTDVTQQADGGISHSLSWYMVMIALLVWGLLVWLARLLQQIEDDVDYSILSRPMWINMLLLALQMMFVAKIGNTDIVFHHRMAVEEYLERGDYQKALEVGKKSLESDPGLLALRMYALARQNALGERLFEYPVTGNASQILPTNGKTHMLLCPVDSLYRFLGARPVRQIEPMTYLELLTRKDSVVSRQVADYRLCGLLINREIDRFVAEIGKYYPIDEQLPRHYREALVLYAHLRAHPVVIYRHPVTEENWKNLQELESHYPNKAERKGKVYNMYGNTYWYYYEYMK